MKKIVEKLERLPKFSELRKKLRVVAYARVSTDKDEQLNSLIAQKDYFIKYIENHKEWEYVGIYFDEGISGVRTKNRVAFNAMIEEGLNGKFDLIITKSISRFARNTVDTIRTIRKLKEKGVGIYFQKEDIHTLDAKGELVLTLMASFAQEESRSISENCKWGQRKRFADGKVTVPFQRFVGYDRGSDGNLVINHEQAKIIECIYSLFVIGYTVSQIKKYLNSHGIPTPSNKEKWNNNAIRSILKNEKYIGDALLQKSFTIDYLTKTKKKNEGELPQYYVEENHEPIISREVYQYVNQILEENKIATRVYSLGGKIICSKCGSKFGSFIIHSEFKSANGNSLAWNCQNKYSKTNKCSIRHIYDKKLYECLVKICMERFYKNGVLRGKMNRLIGKQSYNRLRIDIKKLSVDIGDLVEEIVVDEEHNCVVKWIDGRVCKGRIEGTGKRRDNNV